MAYSALPAKVATDTLTLTNYDAIKDNFAAGTPALMTTKGDLVAATASQAAARLAVGADDATLVPDTSQATGLAWQIQPAVRAYNSANLALSAGVWTALTLNSERFDTDGMHSTSSNTSRLTVPAGGAGLYLIGASVKFDTSTLSTGNYIGLYILLNGTTVIAEHVDDGTFGGAPDTSTTISALYSLAVSDYVEVFAYCSQALNVLASSAFSPEFWAIWQRRP